MTPEERLEKLKRLKALREQQSAQQAPSPAGTGTVLRTDAAPAPQPQPSGPAPDPARIQHHLDQFAKEGRQFRSQDELMAVARSLAQNEIAQPAQSPDLSRGQAFSLGVVDAGQALPGVKQATAGLANLAFGGDVSGSDIGRSLRDAKTDAREQHPISTLGGDIVGFGAGIGRLAVPVLNKAAAKITGTGAGAQAARYGTRLAGLAGLGLAENAVYEGTTGARNRAGDEGRAPTFSDGVQGVIRGGTDPIAAAVGPLGSLAFRGGRKLIKGEFAPDAVAQAIGTGSSASDSAVAQVLGTNRLSADDVGSVGLIHRILTNANIPPERIDAGFKAIGQAFASGSSSRSDLAQLIEREFANEAPGVSEGIRSIILRSGLKGSDATQQVLQGRIDGLRKTQAEDFRSGVANELGDLPRFEASQDIQRQLSDIGEQYNVALANAPTNTPQAAAALQTAQAALEEVPSASSTIALRALRANISPEEYVQRNPFQALHEIQSDIQSVDLLPVRRRLQAVIEQGVPDYASAKQEYARVAGARDALGGFQRGNSLGDPEKYQKGFGDSLVSSNGTQSGATRTAFGEAQIADQYARIAGGDDQTLAAANLSIRDALTDPLRGTKATAVDPTSANSGIGQDTALARLGQLQSEGVVDALPNILGDKGQRISQQLRDLIGERQYLADIDPRIGSNTVNKAEAIAEGDQAIATGLGRISGDTFDLANVSRLPMFARRALRPRQSRQDGVAELLTRRVNSQAPAQRPSGPTSGPPSQAQPVAASGVGQRLTGSADKAVIAGAVGLAAAPTAGAEDQGGFDAEIAALTRRTGSLETSIQQDEQQLADFTAMSVSEKQAFMRDNLGLAISVDGAVGPETANAIEQFKGEINGRITSSRSELETARARRTDLEISAVNSEQDPGNPYVEKGLALAAGLGGIYAAKRLRGRGLASAATAARGVENRANALVAGLPVPPAAPSRTLLSRLPVVGRGERERIATETAQAADAQRAFERRLSGANARKFTPTGPNSVETRATSLNEFYSQGGAAGNELPFRQGRGGQLVERKRGVMNESELFQPQGQLARAMSGITNRVRSGDVAVTATGGADAALMQPIIESAQKDKKEATEDLRRAEAARDAQGIEAARARINQASQIENVALTAQRVGLGLAAGGALGTLKGSYATPRPRMEAAARERSLIGQQVVPPARVAGAAPVLVRKAIPSRGRNP